MVPLGYERVLPGQGQKVLFRISEDRGSCTPNHWHNALEFIYLLEGETAVAASGKRSWLKQEDFILINSREIHSAACPFYNRAALLQIPEEVLCSCVPQFEKIRFFVDSTETGSEKYAEKIKKYRRRIGELAAEMARLGEERKAGWLLPFYSRLFELLELFYREFSETESGSEIPVKNRQAAVLEKVLSFTEAHYREPVKLSEAAEAAALQPQYFCRFFKKTMGMSYIQYLNEYRLFKVCGELFQTERPLGELLEAHGFTNDKLFRRLFWERFGMTPSEMKAGRRKEKE